MPPSRSRTANPQGRQKSCSECVKGKRKCDLQQPHCVRCMRLKLLCTYPSPPHTPVATTTSASLTETLVTNGVNETLRTCQWTGADAPQFTATLDSELLEFEMPGFDLGSIEGGAMINMSSPVNTFHISREKSISMFTLCPLAEARLGYSMDQWKLMPEMMVKENCTHWCHPKLYEEYMPRPLQDAYAACALSLARTDTNATFIARHVTERAYELIDQSHPTPLVEILARTHALLLYQMILVCSGDIRCFNQVEKLIPHIENAGAALFATACIEDSTDSLPLYPSSAARKAWTTFILRESCRRTLLMTLQATSVGLLLLGQYPSCAHHMSAGNRFTASAALWNAKSPHDFALAWNQKNHFLVKGLDFKEVLREARADDLDVFGRMMLIGD